MVNSTLCHHYTESIMVENFCCSFCKIATAIATAKVFQRKFHKEGIA